MDTMAQGRLSSPRTIFKGTEPGMCDTKHKTIYVGLSHQMADINTKIECGVEPLMRAEPVRNAGNRILAKLP